MAGSGAATLTRPLGADYQRQGEQMKSTRLTVGDRARAMGLNITTFGRAAELAPGTARKYFYGTINVFDGDVLERIAKALRCSVSDLFEQIDAKAHGS